MRLVPIRKSRARWLRNVTAASAALLAVEQFLPALIEETSGSKHLPDALRFVLISLLTVGALIGFCIPARRVPDRRYHNARRRLPKIPKGFLAAAVIVAIYLIWILDDARTGAMLAIAAGLLTIACKMRELVFHYWKDHIAVDPFASEGAGTDPQLVPTIMLAGLRLLAVLAGLAAAASAMGASFAGMATDESPMVRFGLRVLGVVALGFVANVVWIAIRSSIDHRLRFIGTVDHGEGNPNARLLTLLPLLRITAAITIGGMFVLSSLWGLGIEITPLLAGAGVLGIALGFGAQALVRDVIAGIFLLVEDVFRVGEYIESGTSAKGTVERITLRTVALRHHNGPLHFVPYGSLGAVRNNSRDWVIEKFNLPFRIDVDSEKVRKMIKKIGKAMMDDPEIGPLMLAPLKGKLYRVDPGIKIFRCNFQTAPGNQYDVRADAYKRIEAAMQAMGVTFADGTQSLIVSGSSTMGIAEVAGTSGLAQ